MKGVIKWRPLELERPIFNFHFFYSHNLFFFIYLIVAEKLKVSMKIKEKWWLLAYLKIPIPSIKENKKEKKQQLIFSTFCGLGILIKVNYNSTVEETKLIKVTKLSTDKDANSHASMLQVFLILGHHHFCLNKATVLLPPWEEVNSLLQEVSTYCSQLITMVSVTLPNHELNHGHIQK